MAACVQFHCSQLTPVVLAVALPKCEHYCLSHLPAGYPCGLPLSPLMSTSMCCGGRARRGSQLRLLVSHRAMEEVWWSQKGDDEDEEHEENEVRKKEEERGEDDDDRCGRYLVTVRAC